MTNFDFYKDQILTIAENGSGLALRRNGELTGCDNCICENCVFSDTNGGFGCEANMIKWLYSEHVEKPKINKRTKMFFDAVETGWVARDEDGQITLYNSVPIRDHLRWYNCAYNAGSEFVELAIFDFLTLDFIKWKDNEPWRVEDIRNLEVEG